MKYDYSRYYQNWHKDSEEHFKTMISYYKNLLEKKLLNTPKNARILEIGSGMGFCLLALKEMGFANSIGIDLDESQSQIAKEKNLDVEHISAVDFFEKTSEAFDIVLMFDVLEHIEKKSIIPLLSEINKRMNTNALFICQTPNCYSITGSAFRYVDFTHEISFSPYSLDFVLYNAGFSNVTIEEQNPLPKLSFLRFLRHPRSNLHLFLRHFFRLIYRKMLSYEVGDISDLPLSANIIATAQKTL